MAEQLPGIYQQNEQKKKEKSRNTWLKPCADVGLRQAELRQMDTKMVNDSHRPELTDVKRKQGNFLSPALLASSSFMGLLKVGNLFIR